MPARKQTTPNFRHHPTARAMGVSADWAEKSASYWLDVCRQWSFARDRIKTAELGGSPDTPFEVALANLAHSYLRERAAHLMEYEVGFSLLEKNSENTKAVGVFGFKVGDQWLYAPVFFLNGDLKGHELLYIKNQDMFVPLKDNWLNYLLGRKPAMLGQQVGRNLGNIGVLGPNLQQLSRSPYKYASAGNPKLPGWTRDFIPILASLAYKQAGALPEFLPALETAGRAGLDFMLKMAEEFPTIWQIFTSFHGPEPLTKLAQKIRDQEQRAKLASVMHRWAAGDIPPNEVRFQEGTEANGGQPSYGRAAWHSVDGYIPTVAKQPASAYDKHLKHSSVLGRLKRSDFGEKKVESTGRPGNKVQIILREDFQNGGTHDYLLSADEKNKLIQEGRVVKDDRPDSAVSKVYTRTTSLSLMNPDETNVYDVLVRPDKFERCLIIMAPYGRRGREDHCTIVSLDEDDRWLNIHPSNVFCRSRLSRQAWNEWYDKLPDANSLSISGTRYGRRGEYCIILGRGGQGTTPVSAYEEYTAGGEKNNSSGGSIYAVSFDDYCGFQNSKPFFSSRPHPLHGDDFDRRSIDHVRFTDRIGTEFRATVDELQVPTGFKKLVVRAPKNDGPDGENIPSGRSDKRPLQPGDLTDLLYAVQNSMPSLDVVADKDEYYINDHKMYKDAAFSHLVFQWGLRAEMADHLLKTARQESHKRHGYWVKLASPFLTQSAPGGPGIAEPPISSDSFFNTQVPFQPTYEQEQYVPGLLAEPGNREYYKPVGPDPDTMQIAQQAAQTGQREIFDTAMLGSLLKSVRSDSMVDRYMGDLMKGVDRLGRIYFQFLWHGEEFEKRYGKQDLPEIEDGIRNAFEAVGDIVLRLQQKTVEPFADEAVNDVDLGAIANQ